jgi:exopolyphosphatase / guanosine-5'-triphosphate,3'-diphosphate pyrophosphatase
LRLAVLDVGSDTVHLVVVDGQPDGTFVPVARERETLRLAEAAFPTMLLPEEAVERLAATVTRMRARADALHADALVGFATSAIREARNGIEALGRVREATGVAVTVLPGVEEARLTYVAARRWTAFSARRLLVVDIGGGSLEVAAGEADRPDIAESLPLGATRLSRRFVRSDPVDPEELVALRVHAPALLGPLAERIRTHPYDVMCATSKTFRNLGQLARALPEAPTPPHTFGFAGIDGRTAPVLTREALDVVAGYLATTTARQHSRLAGLDELRARNVVAGSQVAQSAHHKHSLYLIRNGDLDGFTPRECDLIANIARYHRKALPADRHAD